MRRNQRMGLVDIQPPQPRRMGQLVGRGAIRHTSGKGHRLTQKLDILQGARPVLDRPCAARPARCGQPAPHVGRIRPHLGRIRLGGDHGAADGFDARA